MDKVRIAHVAETNYGIEPGPPLSRIGIPTIVASRTVRYVGVSAERAVTEFGVPADFVKPGATYTIEREEPNV